jgi:DNA-binding helix-hairpin-helix protein with protein kinase domain
MEIRLKTAEEFHAAHVTIEIRATPEEATEVSQRLFTADEVGHYQGTEAELVAAPLRRRIGELETALARSIEREDRLESDEADRAAEHRRSLAARDHLLSAATTRLNAVREILLATAVSRARDEIVTSKGAVLADAIGNALHALEG